MISAASADLSASVVATAVLVAGSSCDMAANGMAKATVVDSAKAGKDFGVIEISLVGQTRQHARAAKREPLLL